MAPLFSVLFALKLLFLEAYSYCVRLKVFASLEVECNQCHKIILSYFRLSRFIYRSSLSLLENVQDNVTNLKCIVLQDDILWLLLRKYSSFK